jgi:hypothetical protein
MDTTCKLYFDGFWWDFIEHLILDITQSSQSLGYFDITDQIVQKVLLHHRGIKSVCIRDDSVFNERLLVLLKAVGSQLVHFEWSQSQEFPSLYYYPHSGLQSEAHCALYCKMIKQLNPKKIESIALHPPQHLLENSEKKEICDALHQLVQKCPRLKRLDISDQFDFSSQFLEDAVRQSEAMEEICIAVSANRTKLREILTAIGERHRSSIKNISLRQPTIVDPDVFTEILGVSQTSLGFDANEINASCLQQYGVDLARLSINGDRLWSYFTKKGMYQTSLAASYDRFFELCYRGSDAISAMQGFTYGRPENITDIDNFRYLLLQTLALSERFRGQTLPLTDLRDLASLSESGLTFFHALLDMPGTFIDKADFQLLLQLTRERIASDPRYFGLFQNLAALKLVLGADGWFDGLEIDPIIVWTNRSYLFEKFDTDPDALKSAIVRHGARLLEINARDTPFLNYLLLMIDAIGKGRRTDSWFPSLICLIAAAKQTRLPINMRRLIPIIDYNRFLHSPKIMAHLLSAFFVMPDQTELELIIKTVYVSLRTQKCWKTFLEVLEYKEGNTDIFSAEEKDALRQIMWRQCLAKAHNEEALKEHLGHLRKNFPLVPENVVAFANKQADTIGFPTKLGKGKLRVALASHFLENPCPSQQS